MMLFIQCLIIEQIISLILKKKIGSIHIEDNVFIGSHTIILCDVNIGSNDIPANSVYAGVPAKYICSFDEFVEKRKKII